MRRSKEIMILLALLLGMMSFVIWYVIDRRTKMRLPGDPAAHGVSGTFAPAQAGGRTLGGQSATTGHTGPAAAGNGAPAAPVVAPSAPPATSPVDLTQHDSQTIDFSSGAPLVKDTAEDRAAIEQAKKDMAEAVKGVTFGPPAKQAAPAPAPSAEPPKP